MYAWPQTGMAAMNAHMMHQQSYWQQYGYGAPQPPPPAEAQPASTSLNPAPPVKPPPEELKPPLPSEPPPPEAPPPPDDENVKSLQQQASQWSQQQQQWQKYQQDLIKYQQQQQQLTKSIPPQATPIQRQQLLTIQSEEQQFEQQYSDWVKQYNDWKEQNKNHPDRSQFEQYEQQFKQYELQMEQKRADIAQRKQAVMAEMTVAQPQTAWQGQQTVGTDATAASRGSRGPGPRGTGGMAATRAQAAAPSHLSQGSSTQKNRFGGPRGQVPGNQGFSQGPSALNQHGFSQVSGGPRGAVPSSRGAVSQGGNFGGPRGQVPGKHSGFDRGPGSQSFSQRSAESAEGGDSFAAGQDREDPRFKQSGLGGPSPGNQKFSQRNSDTFEKGGNFGTNQSLGRGFSQGATRGPSPNSQNFSQRSDQTFGNTGHFQDQRGRGLNRGGSRGPTAGGRGGFSHRGNYAPPTSLSAPSGRGRLVQGSNFDQRQQSQFGRQPQGRNLERSYGQFDEGDNDGDEMDLEDDCGDQIDTEFSSPSQWPGFRGRGRGGVQSRRGGIDSSRGAASQGHRYGSMQAVEQFQHQFEGSRGGGFSNRGRGGRGGLQGPPSLMDLDTSQTQEKKSGPSKPVSLLDLDIRAPAKFTGENNNRITEEVEENEENSQTELEASVKRPGSNAGSSNNSVQRPPSALSEQSDVEKAVPTGEAREKEEKERVDRVSKDDFINLQAMDMEAMGLPVNFGADAFDEPKAVRGGRGGRGADIGGRGSWGRGRGGYEDSPGFGRGIDARGRGSDTRGRGFDTRGRGFDGRGRGFDARGRGADVRGRGIDTRGRGGDFRGRGSDARGRGAFESARGRGGFTRGRGAPDARGRGGFDACGRGRGRGAVHQYSEESFEEGDEGAEEEGGLALFSQDQLDLLKKTADELKMINSQKETLDMLAEKGLTKREGVTDGHVAQQDEAGPSGFGGRGRGRGARGRGAVGQGAFSERSEVDPLDDLQLGGKSRKEKLLAIREMLLVERQMALEEEQMLREPYADMAPRLRDPLRDPRHEHYLDPMRDPYREPFRDPMREPAHDALREPFRDPVRHPMRDPMRDPFRGPGRDPLRDPMRDPLRDPVRDPLRDPMSDPMRDPLRDPLHDPYREPGRDPYSDLARDPYRDPPGDPYRDPAADPVRDPYRDPYADYPPRDPYAREPSPPPPRSLSPIQAVPAQVIEYGHGGDDRAPAAERGSRDGDVRSITSRDEDLRSLGGDSHRRELDDRSRDFDGRPPYDGRRSPFSDRERRLPPDTFDRDHRGVEPEYDRGRFSERGREFDRDRDFNRERDLDRYREADMDRDFERGRDYDHGRDIDRDVERRRNFDREHHPERGREIGRDRENSREFDRDRGYPRDREMRDRRRSPPSDFRQEFDRGRGGFRGREFERGGREERDRDREARERHRVDDHVRDRSRERLHGRDSERFDRDPNMRIKRDQFGRDMTLRRDFESARPRGNYDPYSKEAEANKPKAESISVEDLFCDPGRKARPERIVVIIRGPPGAGKTYVSKLLKEKEISNGGAPPRVMSIDDYFMVENEKIEKDVESGKVVKKTVLEYEYDPDMEDTYRQSFFKTFKKQVENCYFNFIIVDAVFERAKHVADFWTYAKSNGFQVYVAEVSAEASVCAKRNVHSRSLKEIERLISRWEDSPNQIIRLDLRSLLQDDAIIDVEMEDATEEEEKRTGENDGDENKEVKNEEDEDVLSEQGFFKSKWDETTEEKLDKLDGLRLKKLHEPRNMEEFLQLADDYETRKSDTGKKHVRWADIEEKKSQERMRDIGFVVGQTNWDKMMDESHADRALNQTKFI